MFTTPLRHPCLMCLLVWKGVLNGVAFIGVAPWLVLSPTKYPSYSPTELLFKAALSASLNNLD